MKRQELDPAVAELYLKRLEPDEFERRVRASIANLDDPEELENVVGLIRWFQRRYPTAKERLAFCRRAYAQWIRRP